MNAIAATLSEAEIVRGTTEIVTAFLSRSSMDPSEVPSFIRRIRDELLGVADDKVVVATPAVEQTEAADARSRWAHLPKEPAVPVEESVHQEYLVCLFDGCKKKMLKRYIRAKYGMEEKDYKEFWGLPSDYPMVAPGYSREKSLVAIAQGLGSRIDKTPRAKRTGAAR